MDLISQFVTDPTIRQWLEFFSWLSTIAALLIAFFQLRDIRKDQRRIADRLDRVPSFRAGFGERMESEHSITLRPSIFISKPIRMVNVTLVIHNTGKASASKIIVNYVCGPGIQLPEPTQERADDTIRYGNLPDSDVVLAVQKLDFLHADDRHMAGLTLGVPYKTARHDIAVEISCAEIPCTRVELYLDVVGDTRMSWLRT